MFEMNMEVKNLFVNTKRSTIRKTDNPLIIKMWGLGICIKQ